MIVCPWLPPVEPPLTAACLRAFGKQDRGAEFYERALQYAQSLWMRGYPAQALLLVNRALGSAVEPTDAVLARWPLPYPAVVWLLRHHGAGQFIGNPRRHYQHLATRMVPPRQELRRWRAWACWQLACTLRPEFPADEQQLETEHLTEPSPQEIFHHLSQLGHPTEATDWQALWQSL